MPSGPYLTLRLVELDLGLSSLLAKRKSLSQTFRIQRTWIKDKLSESKPSKTNEGGPKIGTGRAVLSKDRALRRTPHNTDERQQTGEHLPWEVLIFSGPTLIQSMNKRIFTLTAVCFSSAIGVKLSFPSLTTVHFSTFYFLPRHACQHQMTFLFSLNFETRLCGMSLTVFSLVSSGGLEVG